MAFEAHQLVWSFPAGADLSGSQFLAVKQQADGTVVLAGLGDAADGILQNNPTQGQMAQVCIHGITKAICGATVAGTDHLKVDAAGKLAPAVKGKVDSTVSSATDPLIGSNVVAKTLMAAAVGDKFSVFFRQSGAHTTTQA